MEGTIEWLQGVNFRVTSGSGHVSHTDGPEQSGGVNAGMRPMEMVLLGMGGCTAYDVVQMLRKSRCDIETLKIDIRAQRADEIPQVFTAIHLHYRVAGDGVTGQKVRRAIDLSIEKYCSATRMLAATASVTYDFEIMEATA